MDLTLADELAPKSRKHQRSYWRGQFIGLLRTIRELDEKIAKLELDLAITKRDRTHILHHSVTVTVAEEARRRAAAGMRERAATLMEYPRGVPNAQSEIIRELPDPKPKWIRH